VLTVGRDGLVSSRRVMPALISSGTSAAGKRLLDAVSG
jgi:hypothetical protein